MGRCLCGIDHSQPLPAIFTDPPIVLGGAIACCHICQATGDSGAPFSQFQHQEDCAYALSLERSLC